jgi:hypothetical protein
MLNFSFKTKIVPYSIFEFRNQNIENKTKKNVNAKYLGCHQVKFGHFSCFLDNRKERWKNASFEGVKNAQNPCPIRHLGLKKTLLKSAFFRNSRAGKTKFSKSAAKTELKISAKCKILIPSLTPLEAYLDYPILYFLHLSLEASK